MTCVSWRVGALAAALVVAGCGSSRDAAWDSETAPSSRAQRSSPQARAEKEQFLVAADAAWAQRGDQAQLRASIERLEQALSIDSADTQIWARLSRAYYFLADGHLSFDPARQSEMMGTYEKGTRAAERALMELSPPFAQRMRDGARIEEAVSVLDRDAVPALYWRSANLGKWAAAQGYETLLAYKDEVRAIMTRCLELDASYFYAGPHRYFGAFYARAPSFAGGDLDKSREHFEASLRAEPNYFATRVLYAQDYAVIAQDRPLFTEQLDAVLRGNPDALRDAAPENRVEQRKARILMAKVDELFE